MKTFKPFHTVALLSILLFSCSKSKNNPTPTPTATDNYKISVVSGNNQTAAIGYSLKDSIVVKVTDNAQIASGVQVQFVGSGCNEDLITNVNTKTDGTAVYHWSMASDLGQQTLRAVIIAGGKRIDSVSVNATAVTAGSLSLNPKSACTVGEAQRILQLSTGRLITCFPKQTSIRYSDDNGISWNPIKGFGSQHVVEWIATTPQDEIFAATMGEGVFYSKDAGVTWVNISPSTFNKQDPIEDMVFTSGGQLIFTGFYNDTYISLDRGQTWATSSTGLDTKVGYTNPVELKNGDIYILGASNVLYKSTDVGKTWTAQNDRLVERVTAIYVDNNGWFYKSSSYPTALGGVFVSKDNGATFSTFVNFPSLTDQPYMTSLSLQSDGFLYFGELAYSVGRSNGKGLYTDSYAYTDAAFPSFILTKGNVFLYSNLNGISYYKL